MDAAVGVLRQCQTLRGAIDGMATQGIDATYCSLANAFHRAGLRPPGSYLAQAPHATIPAPPPSEPEIDPLDVARQVRAEKRASKSDTRALESALRRLDDTERTLDAFAEVASRPAPDVDPIRLDPARRNAPAFHMLSDVHYGSIFTETDSTFGNAVNPAITANRLRRDFAAVAWKVKTHRHWANVEHLVISMLGDNVEGQLHEETIETAQPALESLVQLYPIYLHGLRYLAEQLAPIR
ncbi:hypothetical protein, partial [Methanoregula sp.]|uniref:hypothetical protein n=1 Tax=Methanoregula sp. TaxID=2052170 RepID=UPI00356AF534